MRYLYIYIYGQQAHITIYLSLIYVLYAQHLIEIIQQKKKNKDDIWCAGETYKIMREKKCLL